MKRIGTILAAAGTALAVAAGFALPPAVFALQDGRRAAQVSTYEAEPVNLQTSASVFDTITLLTENYQNVSVSDAYAQLPRESVQAACRAFIDALSRDGLIAEKAEDFTLSSAYVEICFAAEEEGSADSAQAGGHSWLPLSSGAAAVLWDCTLLDDAGRSVWILLDDATGLAVCLYYWSPEPLPADPSFATQADYAAALNETYAAYLGLTPRAPTLTADLQYSIYTYGEQTFCYYLSHDKTYVSLAPGAP